MLNMTVVKQTNLSETGVLLFQQDVVVLYENLETMKVLEILFNDLRCTECVVVKMPQKW